MLGGTRYSVLKKIKKIDLKVMNKNPVWIRGARENSIQTIV